GQGTQFSSNYANGDGGAILAWDAVVSWDRNTTFSNNVVGGNGGGIAFVDLGKREYVLDSEMSTLYFSAAGFVNNSATNAGALFLSNSDYDFNFTDLSFQNNRASYAGGAVAAYDIGRIWPMTFSRCAFLDNVASVAGGAV
ncbi:unnamed protein product, partial [Ectocarpus sp. 13 AM-2016]